MISHAKIVFRKNKVSSELQSTCSFHVLKAKFQLFASQLSLKKKSNIMITVMSQNDMFPVCSGKNFRLEYDNGKLITDVLLFLSFIEFNF